jgi:FkbM family methyltransferase
LIIQLKKFGIPKFFVSEDKESFYGKNFWKLVQGGIYESEQMSEIIETARKQHGSNSKNKKITFLDIGAANGAYSLIMGSLNYKVFAVEPDTTQFTALKHNVKINKNLDITPINAFIVGNDSFKPSPYALDRGANDFVKIEQIRLEDFKNDGVFLIKFDIEGGEWDVLKSNGIWQLIKSAESVDLFLSIHVGFFSSRYEESFTQRLFFRLRYIDELVTLFNFSRRADLIFYDSQPISPLRLLRHERIFGGTGFTKHVHLVFESEGRAL